MAEGGFKGVITGFILLALFIFAILTFSISVANEYGLNSDDITGGTVNLNNTESFLNTVDSQAKEKRTTFEESGTFTIGGSEVILGIWSVVKGLWTMITTPFYILQGVVINVIFKGSGFGYVVMGVFSGILVLVIILGIWQLWRQGS